MQKYVIFMQMYAGEASDLSRNQVKFYTFALSLFRFALCLQVASQYRRRRVFFPGKGLPQ